MNDFSNGALVEKNSCRPIPSLALYILILIPLFFIGICLSIFLFVVVRNAAFFLSFLLLSSLVLSFILWNTRSSANKAAVLFFLRSLPHTDLRHSPEGRLVKITGRFSTDFYITDKKSGLRAIVKAGSGCRVIPWVVESQLVNTTRQCRTLSPPLRKWLTERNLPNELRLLRLEEGHVQEGSTVTVVGIVHRNNEVTTIVQPPEVMSTGCLLRKLLLPVEIDGLILSVSQTADLFINQDFRAKHGLVVECLTYIHGT